MEREKILADLGTIAETTLGRDLFDPIHERFTATLDHDIEGKLLKDAWEETKRIYPIIDGVLGFEHEVSAYIDRETRARYMGDHLYIIKAEEGENHPIKSKVPITPGTPACGKRLICVTYYKNEIVISAYHTVLDGDGINKIFNTFLYLYLALYSGHEDESPIVELTKGRDISDYYTERLSEILYNRDYTPTPVYTFPLGCRGFLDSDMENDENVYTATLALDAAGFMKYCKSNGINPSALLCAAAAKTAYDENPTKKEDVVVSLTVSLKKMLGREHDISNAVALAYGYARYEDIKNKPIAETAKKIRADVDSQRSCDYYISLFRLFTTYQNDPMFKARLVTYIGRVDIGDNTKHILDYKAETNSSEVVYLMQVGSKFSLSVLYGRATERYLQAYRRFFEEIGIETEVFASVHHVIKSSDTAVL
ncbi:MAG: hypothetical protein K5877_09335 [Lachnospiraceae bacterium]|nr:hypothetical protein [Lachnospiraceae bacterium]